MSYIDVMSGAAYGRYSRKLAGMVGIEAAAYWSEILDIIGHVVKKNAFDGEGYFKVDRKYVEAMTGMTESAQREAEAKLVKLGAMEAHPADPDRVGVMCDRMFSLIAEEDPAAVKRAAKSARLTKADKAAGKRAGIVKRLKDGLDESDPRLMEAYCGWIEAVYGKGIVRSEQVKAFKDEIDRYTDDPEAKAEIIGICTTSSYREAQWGIGKYERIVGTGRASAVRKADRKVATEDSVNKGISF